MRDEEKTREAPNQPNSSYQTETHVVSTSLNLPDSPHHRGISTETQPERRGLPPDLPVERLGGFAFGAKLEIPGSGMSVAEGDGRNK
jgi:hypothetical protein